MDVEEDKIMKKLLSLLTALMLTIVLACPVNVQAAPATLKLNKAKATLEVDATLKLKLGDTDAAKISWKSSNAKIVSVAKTGVITAVKEGTATITATYNSNKYTCSVTVVDSNKEGSALDSIDTVSKYLVDSKLVSGDPIKMESSLIGAKNGVKYTKPLKVEIYEYDTNSKEYKAVKETNKITISSFNMEIGIDAINGKYVLICEDGQAKDSIVKAFKEMK